MQDPAKSVMASRAQIHRAVKNYRRLIACTKRYSANIKFQQTLAIAFVDLPVQGPQIVQPTQTTESNREQIKQTGEPLAHIHAMHTEQAEKHQ